MASYLLQAAYTPEAWAALAKQPENRIEAIRPVVERLGGKLLSGYISFGEYDVMVVMEMPDNTSAAAFAIAASSGGALKSIKTTPLLKPEEATAAMQKAIEAEYEPPAALYEMEMGIGIE